MNSLELALYSALQGTAITALLAGTTSIFNNVVPRGESFPAIVFSLYAGGDANETPRRRKELLYHVKAITSSSMKDAGAIDNQIDTVLHLQTLTVTGWTNYWIARERDIRMVEPTPEGQYYYHSGGIYRFRLCE